MGCDALTFRSFPFSLRLFLCIPDVSSFLFSMFHSFHVGDVFAAYPGVRFPL